jgi:branched-chain amino acid transport system ATP-binding protein
VSKTAELLSASDIFGGYGRDTPVINGVTVSVDAGEIVCIIGPNGAGKSTLLKCILGLVPQVTGSVVVGGRQLAGLTPSALIKAGVAYVPQGHQVFPDLTVAENLEMGCYWLPASKAKSSVERVLELVPQLQKLKNRPAGVLSGGEQQLVSLGRALTISPSVLLVDEPSAGLSPKHVGAVLQILHDLRASGLGVMLVEQNARMALELADTGVVLDLGQVRFQGNARHLLADPAVRALYLGGLQ